MAIPIRLRAIRRVVVGLPAVLGMLAAGAALAAATYPDPSGDVRGGRGPDLTSVVVSNTATAVTFRIGFAQAPPLRVSAAGGWVDMLLIGIDVPPRGPLPAPSHEWRGVDYAVGLHGPDSAALVVKAPRWKQIARVKVRRSGRALSFSIARRTIGNPSSFDFTVAAGREAAQDAAGGEDYAPAGGTFHYRLTR